MSSQELFGDPNTYSQGIWKTRDRGLYYPFRDFAMPFVIFYVHPEPGK